MKSKILKTIEQYDSIVVYGHVNPDGDSFGSQIAMKNCIELNYPNKKVYVAGTGMPNMYQIFGKPDDISDEIIQNSLGIALDFNALYRSEDQRIRQSKEIVMIDHHEPYNGLKEEFPNSIIQSSIAANCTILYDFFKKNRLRVNRAVRNALFYGITTDTNRFMYLEDDKQSFKTAYELLIAGIDMTDIYYLNSKVSEPVLKAKGYILSHYQLYKDRTIYCILPRDYLNEIGFKGYPGFLVNQMANVDNRQAWVLFIENIPGEDMSVEFRSSDKNIRSVAVKFGGGGHTKACGLQSCKHSKQMINDILEELENTLKEA